MNEPQRPAVAWLLCNERVLASAEIATSRRARRRGLLGRDGIEGALVIERCRSVHTFGMRFAIDVVFVDEDGVVVRSVTLRPNRISRPVPRSRWVVETEAGNVGRWGVGPGDELEIRSNDHAPD